MYDHTATPSAGLTDAELVAGHLAGDRSAFAAIYDRYGNALYDVAAAMLRNRHDAADVTQDTFVVAAERMGQLRQPERLKPWLMAILRNEVYRRTGKRSRQIPTDFSLAGAEMALPPAAEHSSAAEFEELATLVRDAAAGLDARDQLVLELAVRQGLEGDDLASALGVSPQQSYSLVHRMRQRTERTLGAFCVARRGRRDCAELDQILAGWDGQFSVLVRKRVARHIDDCAVCERNRKQFVPLALFGAAPAFAAPPDLRDRVLAAVDAGAAGLATTAVITRPYEFVGPAGFPAGVRYSPRAVLWWLMAAAAVMLVLGIGAYLLAGDDEGPLLAIDVPGVTTTTRPPTTSTPPAATAAAPIVAAPTIAPTSAPGGPATTAPAPTTIARPTKTTTATSSTLPFTTTTLAAGVVTSTTRPTTTTSQPATSTTTQPATTTTTPPTTTTQPATTTTVPPPAPGALFLSADTLDFGSSANSLTVQLVNEGAGAAEWAASVVPGFANGAPFSVSPASGTLPPGGIQNVTVTMHRADLSPGSHAATIRFVADGTSAQLRAQGTQPEPDPPPQIRIVRGPEYSPCQYTVSASFEATDNAGAPTVSGSVSGPSGTFPMTIDGNIASAVLGTTNNPPEGGTHTFTLRATDSAGGTATASAPFDVTPCVFN